MRVLAEDLRVLVEEQRLLREVVGLVRRCDGPAPVPLLDVVLGGRGPVRPVVPTMRRPGRRPAPGGGEG